MDTLVLDQGKSTYLVNAARLIAPGDQDVATENVAGDWSVEKSNPFVQWIAGDFAEADNPNQNKQFWTAKDLQLAEYSVLHAPLNMVHKVRQPIGYFAATKTVKLEKPKLETAGDVVELKAKQERKGSLKIQALSGLWTHIFPFEAAQAEAADEAGLLFYSMECRGTHLICGSDEQAGITGCGKKFDYMDIDSHCEHLLERSSMRHIVNPTFRGGALIVPPVRPGWKNAHASVLTDSVMQEAAQFAAQNEAAYEQLTTDGATITASTWEQLMGLAVAAARS
jgi:hypothetical protein